MNIITDNYIWFIISGVVILLITIGYYADKTNFGKKKLGEAIPNDTVSNADNNAQDTPIVLNNVPIGEVVLNNSNTNVIPEQTNVGIADIATAQSNNIGNNNVNTSSVVNSNIPDVSNFSNTNVNGSGTIPNIYNEQSFSNNNPQVSTNLDLNNNDDIWKF